MLYNIKPHISMDFNGLVPKFILKQLIGKWNLKRPCITEKVLTFTR